MRALTEPMQESEAYKRIRQRLVEPGAEIIAESCVPSQKWQLIYCLTREGELGSFLRNRVILTSSDQRAREIADEYRFYDRNVCAFPARDLIFYQADIRGKEIEKERLKVLRRILENRRTTVVTTFSALMTPQVPLRVLKDSVIAIEKHDRVRTAEVVDRLTAMGYSRTHQVQEPGEFSLRGDILDIFDMTEENPVRIDLFDDEVDAIRSFDVESQRSIEPLSGVRIYPATEMILSAGRLQDGLARIRQECAKETELLKKAGQMEAAKRLKESVGEIVESAEQFGDYERLESYVHYFYPQTDSFLELFPPEATGVFFDEPDLIRQEAEAVELEFRESMISRQAKGLVLSGQMGLVRGMEETTALFRRFRRLGVCELALRTPFFSGENVVSVGAKTIAPYHKSFDLLEKDLRKFRSEKQRVVLISASRTRAKRLAGELTDKGLTTFYSENPDRVLQPGEIMTYYGQIGHGFSYPEIGFTVIAETDIFGVERKKKKKRRYEGESIRAFQDLKVGDYVVHEDYGIGIYRGVEKIELEGASRDYIKIEYGEGGILYVLPTELNVLQKYAAGDAASPKLNRLGSTEWTKTRTRVEKAVEEVAQDLVELYAKRQAGRGHVFGPDTVWQKEFEEMFPYEETEDQLQAIADTKADMEAGKIMDRLICGDVGFGKTEIAIRAAFKAVQEGMQVAVLVPTTILAQQHYNTFVHRMQEFPVNIDLLSRFRTKSEIERTIQGLRNGMVDIVVGTHRVLSKDIQFKNLGLLVVDEEQRFGVTHKEKIKKLCENIDVLSMSATPIPRTLHMSLVGIRDMSVLEEAPQDRVPIQTYVMEYNEEMVREAIVRELSRGGQVYYVYNRVNDIDLVTSTIAKLVPEARVSFAHGQMSERELEKIMYDFIEGEIDVLVSTTIIETGLDISNVNTIIIHDSDRMGLSQLYQLRGRVGRSNRTAFAFMMYRKDRMLKEVAAKRLAAIKEYTDLGSGFRIAMRDLEIRGAGTVLGKAQHGHMSAVGYDLYCKLLETAVARTKGETPKKETSTVVRLETDSYIPESYILNEAQKLEVYKRIASIEGVDDYTDVLEELKDRFGEPIPGPAENLLRIALIRAIAGKVDVREITGGGGEIRFTIEKEADFKVENIPLLMKKYGKALSFSPNGAPKGELKGLPFFTLRYTVGKIALKNEESLLAACETFLVDLAGYLRG